MPKRAHPRLSVRTAEVEKVAMPLLPPRLPQFESKAGPSHMLPGGRTSPREIPHASMRGRCGEGAGGYGGGPSVLRQAKKPNAEEDGDHGQAERKAPPKPKRPVT
jgi:hypothetical protein